jgi:pimeloyl-ACP methyl ester carboxylesterase
MKETMTPQFPLAVAALVAITAVSFASTGTAATRIEEAAFVNLGGIQQWTTYRGDDEDRPVLLVVHGGPGDVLSPYLREFAPYEAEFVVVQWDQRGAGRSYGRNGAATPDVTLDRIVEDGLELAAMLKARFGRGVILFGHSWGSVVGVEMVKRRPELFVAYVGTGQVGGWVAGAEAQFDFLEAAAEASDAAALRSALDAVGTFDPNDSGDFQIVNREIRSRLGPADASWLGNLLERAREVLTPQEFADASAGMTLSGRALLSDMLAENLYATAQRLDVRVIIVQGKDDLFTPTDPAAAWLEALDAPSKELIVIDGAGHFALLTHGTEVVAQLKSALAESR